MIDLSASRIGDKRIKSLAKGLANAPCLTFLDLSSNSITDDGALILGDALLAGGAPRLTVLSMRRNQISTDMSEKLTAQLRERKGLNVDFYVPAPVIDEQECMPLASPEEVQQPETPVADIDQLIHCLKRRDDNEQLCNALEATLVMMRHPAIDKTLLGTAIIGHIARVLRIAPDEESLGVRRHLAVSIVSEMVCAELGPEIDSRIADTRACEICCELLFRFEWASVVHSAVLHMVTSLCARGVDSKLFKQFFECKPTPFGDKTLPSVIAKIGSESHVGVGYFGPAVAMALELQQCVDGDGALGQWLSAQPLWEEYAKEALLTHKSTYSSSLGPPAPQRVPLMGQ